MDVKIKRLHPNAIIPSHGTKYSAGMDITAIGVDYSNPDYIEYKTGLSFELEPGYVGLLFPRSSISKMDLTLCNSVGVLDADFRGEITFRFKSSGNKDYKIGDRIGQIIIVPFPNIHFVEVVELGDTERGSGGYGSTNK